MGTETLLAATAQDALVRKLDCRPTDVLPRGAEGWVVACDTETSGLFVDEGATVSVVSVAWLDDEGEPVGYAFPFDQGPRDKVEQVELEFAEDPNLGFEEWQYLLAWLGLQQLVFQNAKFDLHHLRNGTRHWGGVELEHALYWDTMLASRELDPLENTSLKPTAERLGLTDGGERDEEKAMKAALTGVAKRYGLGKRYDLVSWDIIGPYADQDTILTILLWRNQQRRLAEGEGSLEDIEREMDLTRVLYRIERRGMAYDVDASLEAAETLRKRQSEIAEKLPFEPSVNAAKRYFFGPESEGGMGLPPYEVTEKKREPKLDDEVVRRMLVAEIPWAAEYSEWRKLDYSVSMHYAGYPALAGPDGKLRCSFRQAKVVSGRMSVERVQLQAIPHKAVSEDVPPVRALFRASEGRALYEIDLAQAELRVAAKFAKCERMLQMIRDGEDLHGVTCTELFDVTPDSEDWFFYRQISKRGNFSFIFDVGPETFRQTIKKLADVDLPLAESRGIVEAWKGMYPEFGRAVRRHGDVVQARARANAGCGYLTLVNGKRSWFAPHEQTHKAFNRRVQGSLAELNKDWLIAAERITGDHNAMVMSIHDSVILDAPEDGAEEMAQQVADLGASLGTEMFGVPMECDVKLWHA